MPQPSTWVTVRPVMPICSRAAFSSSNLLCRVMTTTLVSLTSGPAVLTTGTAASTGTGTAAAASFSAGMKSA